VGLAEIEDAVGPDSFARARSYARGGRVLRVDWDEDKRALRARVLGQGRIYQTVAFFDDDGAGSLTFAEGECSCPVGHNCKHVAAVVLAARADRESPRSGPNGGAGGNGTGAILAQPFPGLSLEPASGTVSDACAGIGGPALTATEAAAWEQPLRALLDRPAAETQGKPLAFEFTLTARGRTAALTMRLMRPAARGGWVNGQLAWDGLDSWQVRDGGLRADHLAIARELNALHRAASGKPSYYYGYGRERQLDLSECDSRQLWPLLDEARRLGIALIHQHPPLGEVGLHGGEVVLDVRAAQLGGAQVQVALQLEDEHGPPSLRAVSFLGARGHGLVCVEPDEQDPECPLERLPLHLVRLARPVPSELRQMLLAGKPLQIPALQTGRFAAELCPSLQRIAPIVSSDGSFTPPEVSAPELALRASYGPGHALAVGWEWTYLVGDTLHRVALDAGDQAASFRDPEAERALLARAQIADTGLERFGLLDQRARPAARPPVTLHGVESMRFSTEVLPALERDGRFAVIVEGERPHYRDVGETLEVGISTSAIAGERDWFDLGVTIAVEGREVPFADVFAALARGETHMVLADGAHFSLLEPRLQALRALIEEARLLSDSPGCSPRISRYQAGLWGELVALGVVREQAQAWQRQVGALLSIDELAEHDPPAGMRGALRPYQLEGFRWLASLWELELGGILADDMGLGKTLQALALICHVHRRALRAGPFLVITPTSVVGSWVSEAARFAPELSVAAVTDTLAKAGCTIEQLIACADVIVTTYTLLRLDADAYGHIDWAGVILDEAQYVKNHQAKTYRCVRQLRAAFKLALTGTPLENNLMELWSLLSISSPGLFPDPKRFAEAYARPIERGGDRERLARLRRRIKPLVKRRTKELVASELPAKQEQALEVELHPRHRRLYDTYLQRERQKILGLLSDFERNRFTILRSITLLRQMSLHAALVDRRHEAVPCAKLDALVDQLEDIVSGGHRALIFSQFTGFLARARARLERARIAYTYLDGKTRQRERVLERFKRGSDPVFLISLKAGGFGLNLTEADYCLLLDPWWNPAVEDQAIDRAHRIGQSRPVIVYRLLSRGTIEEKVAALARRKAELFRGVMDEGDLFASRLTAEDIRGLLG